MTNSLRLSRKAAFRPDILMLVLVALALIALGVVCMMRYDTYKQDRNYVEKFKALEMRYQAEWSRVQEQAVFASQPLGFKHIHGELPSLETISNLLYRYQEHKPKVWDVSEEAVGQKKEEGLSVLQGGEPGRLSKSSVSEEPYLNVQMDLMTLIAKQDAKVNDLLKLLRRISLLRDQEQKDLDEGKREWIESSNNKKDQHRQKLDDVNQKLLDNSEGQEEDLRAETAAAKEAHGVLEGAYVEVEAEKRRLDEERLKVGASVEEASRLREKAITLLSERTQARAREQDPDGQIVFVDENNDWAFINLGQSENIRNEMTFRVIRSLPGKQGYITIASLRVKEVLSGEMSRCRIDSLHSDEGYPRVGDLIINEKYSKEQPYLRYAFLGEFGGEYSRLSQQELKELLLKYGRQVVPLTDESLEVVVLGGNWNLKEEYNQLIKKGVRFEVMTEEEILYMLGISGPITRE